MDRVLAVDPDNFMALAMSAMGVMGAFEYGYAATSGDLVAVAIARSAKAVELNGGNVYVRFMLALVDLHARQDFDGAMHAANSSLELNPNFSFTKFALGLALAGTGDLSTGLACIDQIVASDTETPYLCAYLDARGTILIALEEYARADDTFARSDRLVPGTVRCLIGLAVSRWLACEEEPSRQAVASIVALAPEIRARDIHFLPIGGAATIDRMRAGLVAASLPE